MALEELPDVMVKETMDGGEFSIREVFAGKKGVLFGVPGAFTPGCSETHVPGYISNFENFKAAGAEVIAVVATNDAFIMKAWGKQTGGGDVGIRFLADHTGNLSRGMGLDQLLAPLNELRRFKRFSAIIDNNKVLVLNVEPDGTGKTISLAEPTLEQFKTATVSAS